MQGRRLIYPLKTISPKDLRIIDSRLDEIDIELEGRVVTGVRPKRPFPYTHPEVVILYTGADEELGIILDYRKLDEKSLQHLEKVFSIMYYMPQILKINSIERVGGQFHWKVVSDKGELEFYTWGRCVRVLPDGRLIVKDVNERAYHVASPEKLDSKSRILLELML